VGNYNKFRKIRKIAHNQSKDVPIFGISIPEVIANQFKDVSLTVRANDTQIILESGART
jgi:hypothetical protein